MNNNSCPHVQVCGGVENHLAIILLLVWHREIKLYTLMTFYKVLRCLSKYLHLRNRKHVRHFYWVIEIWLEVWENKKCCWNMSCRQLFPQLFWVLPIFHKCFYNSIETWRTCFLFLLENTTTKKRDKTCLFWSWKCKFSLLAPLLCHQFCKCCVSIKFQYKSTCVPSQIPFSDWLHNSLPI